ncbi:metal-sensitive transcriptional regulator [Candidatus Microgenomates bacterium]|nr:metal-sensitive transcriptional regulator [Candidatus Microgenomates bacterium]
MLSENKKQKQKVLICLKKANSHIKKVVQMTESGDYCIDIIQQILAVQGLLRSCQAHILESHLETCFLRGMEGKSEKNKKELIKEILRITKLSNKYG